MYLFRALLCIDFILLLPSNKSQAKSIGNYYLQQGFCVYLYYVSINMIFYLSFTFVAYYLFSYAKMCELDTIPPLNFYHLPQQSFFFILSILYCRSPLALNVSLKRKRKNVMREI
ncbi:uncharacterized protein BX664DRAFT_162552 [Halteromyces radiatus]|uniref:uncharacterized protein n=1 Tax=Halteromyces radiatus TaxID=101107 RepID=UPI0022200B11|nr:uncharacterized protein BX664DRAFT_162552 [Halteromyces radiatus]KAI8086652.1 hypothetical protein BX664DRAFT_162552 [Halteromyces radiatus]